MHVDMHYFKSVVLLTCSWWFKVDDSCVFNAQYVLVLGEQRRSCLFHVYIIFRPCVICQSFKSWHVISDLTLTLFSFCGCVLTAQIENVLTVCVYIADLFTESNYRSIYQTHFSLFVLSPFGDDQLWIITMFIWSLNSCCSSFSVSSKIYQ